MSKNKTDIIWEEYGSYALLPNGTKRNDWWNFIKDGQMPETNVIATDHFLALLLAGKIQTLANLIQEDEKTHTDAVDSQHYRMNVRTLLTIDDNFMGSALAKEIVRRKLRCMDLRPLAMFLHVETAFYLSPAERFQDKVDQILKGTPTRAEESLRYMQSGGATQVDEVAHNLGEAPRLKPTNQDYLTAGEKNRIWDVWLKNLNQDNIDKILRIGDKIGTPEQQETLQQNEQFRQKLFERRFSSGKEMPPARYREACFEKKRFLAHKKPIKWDRPGGGSADLEWKNLMWISDEDVPVELLLPDNKNNILRNISGREYPGEFPNLPKLAAIANRLFSISRKHSSIGSRSTGIKGGPPETTIGEDTRQTMTRQFNSGNIQELYRLHPDLLHPEILEAITINYAGKI